MRFPLVFSASWGLRVPWSSAFGLAASGSVGMSALLAREQGEDVGFTCTTCGQYHSELPMCFGQPAPALWLQMSEAERAKRGELSSDQCVVDNEHYFVLGRILLPVVDGPEPFCWLAWVSLSERNFLRTSELWHVA